MFSGSDKFSINQRSLIENLSSKLSFYRDLHENRINEVVIQDRVGMGTIDDNMKMIQRYICSCGSSTKQIAHSTKCQRGGELLDSYHLNCLNCGDEEKISFHMMKDTLQKSTDERRIQKKNQYYPYM